jgi:hypothetical protein
MKLTCKTWLVLAIIGSFLRLSVCWATGGDREIKPVKQWRGRTAWSLVRNYPVKNFLSSQKELNELWTAWRLPGEPPSLDFRTHILLVATCTCSHITVSPCWHDGGNLTMGVTITKDLTPDAAYIMALIPRAGIRTVEGKPL